jgi:hypothetical protein
MTITVSDPKPAASSLSAALARIASTRSAVPATVNPYRAVTVRVTVSNGEITKVVAV